MDDDEITEITYPLNDGEPQIVDLKESNDEETSDILFDVTERPPWYITFAYVTQQILSLAPGVAAQVVVIHKLVCGGEDYKFAGELLSRGIFMLGLGTILQITFGIRLPLIQGSSWVFFAPIISMMQSEKYQCTNNATLFTVNMSDVSNAVHEPEWSTRIRTLSGSMIVGSAVQVVLGLSGAFGIIMPYIGPITIAPAFTLLGLSIYSSVVQSAQQNWGIALLTVGLFVLFSAVMRNVRVPLLNYEKGKGFFCSHCGGIYLFRLLPNFTAVGLVWLLCFILTISGVFPDDPKDHGYMARTDAKAASVHHTQWFYFPLPGQWGPPLFDLGVIFSMIIASVMGMVESVGDYYILARVCNKPTPPRHALNRGLAMEGFINIICGLLNMGQGTASYTAPMAFIKISGVASRIVWQIVGLGLILVAVLGKVGGFLATIPVPILGGTNIVYVGLLIFVGIGHLQYVDMNSSRNIMILGVSVVLGLVVPSYVMKTGIHTGIARLDEALTAMLNSEMFLGALIAFSLDNIVPGTRKERGISKMNKLNTCTKSNTHNRKSTKKTHRYKVYDLPILTKARLESYTCCTFVPFLPAHVERDCQCCQSVRAQCFRNENSRTVDDKKYSSDEDGN